MASEKMEGNPSCLEGIVCGGGSFLDFCFIISPKCLFSQCNCLYNGIA